MEKDLKEFTDELKSTLGDNLVSVILYGSAAKDEHSSNSDVNMIVVLKNISLDDLSSIEGLIVKSHGKMRISPVFWTEKEFTGASDVFPLEFSDMLGSHKVLHGPDLFDKLSIDTKNLRHQLEFELRTKLLRLRHEWLHAKSSKDPLADFLMRAGTSYCYLFQHARLIAGEKLREETAEPFKKCILLKKNEISLDRTGLEKLFANVHDAAAHMTAVINDL